MPEPEHLVLLHGFGGTHRYWDGVLAALPAAGPLPLALDLPGHGEAAGDALAAGFDAVLAGILQAAPKRFALCGYSLGGRLALHAALRAPERVGRLVLVSSTAGIEDPRERAERRDSDERLARVLETEPYEDFVGRWRSQPLFAADPPEVAARAAEDQRRNRPEAMAAVMRALGTGQMTPVWDRLGELRMPVLILVGERDEKFRAIGRRMAQLIPDAALRVLPGGHSLALESPAAVADAIASGA